MYKNWIKTNIVDIASDKTKKFDVKLKLYHFKPTSFRQATVNTIENLIKRNGKLYVTLSGGSDSSYIVKMMHEMQIDFVPVIVNTPWLKYEVLYAYHWCEISKIKPIILELTEQEYLKIYTETYKKWGNCRGTGTIPAIYAGKKLIDRGHIVAGINLINDGDQNPRTINFDAHDFYFELFNLNVEPFFIDNLQIVDSFLSRIEERHIRTDFFKSELYEIPYRPKISLGEHISFNSIAEKIKNIPDQRPFNEVINLNFDSFKKKLKEFHET